MNKINKKIITLVLIFTFIFSPTLAIPANAQWIDLSTMAKDYGLDALAFQIVNTIIKRISASTVNWINSGFKGKPAYVTDPEAYFTDIGDKVAGQYIFSNPNLNFLCGPIQAKIRLALTRNYIQEQQWQCTLTDVAGNMDDFLGNFERGGWDKFFEMTQRQQNNPIGAYLLAENELSLQISSRQGTAKAELNQGSGFLSYKECKPGTEIQPQSVTRNAAGLTKCDLEYNSCIRNGDDAGNSNICIARLKTCDANTGGGSLQAGDCKESDKRTVTPGSVISDKLNNVLDQSEGRLQMADEINEMISALISQLTEKLIGAATKGLRGLSSPDSTNDNRSFTNQLVNDNSNTDYFGNAPDTTVLDEPIKSFDPNCDPNSPTYTPNAPTCTATQNNPTTPPGETTMPIATSTNQTTNQ